MDSFLITTMRLEQIILEYNQIRINLIFSNLIINLVLMVFLLILPILLEQDFKHQHLLIIITTQLITWTIIKIPKIIFLIIILIITINLNLGKMQLVVLVML